ncbi:nucleoside deaminase [Sporosarcina sp. JAI121]|uniref:nucleoside deaminase n=1 Tax=Sporosarcina sp. JAI121 TaxID=2723064 RepID=UPI0015C9A423|nr:nucleoside deaminase [Sporosarcina sp. JAI121]NYF25885.1 guanine deaminase [Sporosarcina sp. JAI121]
MTHAKWLTMTIDMAIQNVKEGGGPFAAIIVKNGEIIGRGTNRVHLHNDPSAHAELLAIREACSALASVDLSDCTLYASGEPCPMCLGAAYWATVGTIYYACSKIDALNGAAFTNPLDGFFADQNEAPEKRLIPFIHMRTDDSLSPFHEWNHVNNG